MKQQGLYNIQKFGNRFQVMEESPSYVVLSTGLSVKRMRKWLLLLLSYDGIEELKIPGSFISVLPEITEFPVSDIVEILDISRSTYYRIKDELWLEPETADKISSLLKLFYYGLEAFEGKKEDFRDWLNTSIPTLDNKKPVHLLKTESGRTAVLDAIARVEHNVYG